MFLLDIPVTMVTFFFWSLQGSQCSPSPSGEDTVTSNFDGIEQRGEFLFWNQEKHCVPALHSIVPTISWHQIRKNVFDIFSQAVFL